MSGAGESAMGQLSILEQWDLVRAYPRSARFAFAVGVLPPAGGFTIVHFGLEGNYLQPLALVALACIMFSVTKVYRWGAGTFGSRLDGLLYVTAAEGMMVFCTGRLIALSVVALAYLLSINAIATACNLIAQSKKTAAEKPVPTVAAVVREQNLPRRAAAKIVDQQLAKQPKPSPA